MAIYEWLKLGDGKNTIDKDAAAEIDQIMVSLEKAPEQEVPSTSQTLLL
jgi:hypothetical protein